MKTSSIFAACGAAVALGLSAGVASAGSVVLGNSGWTASWAPAFDGVVNVTVASESASQVVVNKSADFSASMVNPAGYIDPVAIVIQQTSPTAVSQVLIGSETIANNTGKDWGNYRNTILGGSGVTFDPAASSIGPAGFTIAPFTAFQFRQNDTILDFGNGVVPDSSTFLAMGGNGYLVIDANPFTGGGRQAFTLKEQPSPTNGSGPGPAIPLPAGVWTGLGALGVLGSLRKLRQSRTA